MLALLLLIGAGLFFFVVPGEVERRFNRVLTNEPRAVSEKAREVHRTLFVADLHADSLLWDRDLLERGTRGHVDVPRLLEGNVGLQAFTIVSKTPRGMNIESNGGDTDNITPLVVAGRWPPRTWGSLKERALHQAAKLHELAARSGGKLTLIKSAADLSAYLERRRAGTEMTAGMLGVEGAQVLEGDLANLDAMFDAGFRMMAPTHFFDTEIGGSAHGMEKGGLSALGREWVVKMEARGMTIDLAHASPATIDDVLKLATRPVVVSHTGVKGTCDNRRNLSDEQLRAIARTGGVIGIGYWDTAVCGTDAASIARAIRYTSNLIGAEHVALGSDFDGAVTVPFDTSRLVEITDALIAAGFDEPDIRKVMGENVVRVLTANLPEK